MRGRKTVPYSHRASWFGALLAGTILGPDVRSDEGGVSFWLPGQFGSFSAVQRITAFKIIR